jgi:hypothetical protein
LRACCHVRSGGASGTAEEFHQHGLVTLPLPNDQTENARQGANVEALPVGVFDGHGSRSDGKFGCGSEGFLELLRMDSGL